MTVGDATGLDGDDERVLRRFADLVEFGREAAYLTSFGSDAYREDSPQGRLLRNGGERILIKVATVVEKLPHEFRDAHPGID